MTFLISQEEKVLQGVKNVKLINFIPKMFIKIIQIDLKVCPSLDRLKITCTRKNMKFPFSIAPCRMLQFNGASIELEINSSPQSLSSEFIQLHLYIFTKIIAWAVNSAIKERF